MNTITVVANAKEGTEHTLFGIPVKELKCYASSMKWSGGEILYFHVNTDLESRWLKNHIRQTMTSN